MMTIQDCLTLCNKAEVFSLSLVWKSESEQTQSMLNPVFSLYFFFIKEKKQE